MSPLSLAKITCTLHTRHNSTPNLLAAWRLPSHPCLSVIHRFSVSYLCGLKTSLLLSLSLSLSSSFLFSRFSFFAYPYYALVLTLSTSSSSTALTGWLALPRPLPPSRRFCAVRSSLERAFHLGETSQTQGKEKDDTNGVGMADEAPASYICMLAGQRERALRFYPFGKEYPLAASLFARRLFIVAPYDYLGIARLQTVDTRQGCIRDVSLEYILLSLRG